jgi:hypothetical protein
LTCSHCGLPKGVGKANAWNSNGTIVGKLPPYLRGNLCDVEELNHLFSSFSERIGFDITRLVIEGKRKDAMIFSKSMLKQFELAGIEPPEPLDLLQVMAKYSSTVGFCRVELMDYKEGESFTIEVEGIYNIAMFQGQAAGTFEAIFNKRGGVDWEGDAEHGKLRIYAMEGEPELEQAIESEIEALLSVVDEGDIQYELCPECSAPRDLSRDFDWNIDKALILERRTGKRFVFNNTQGIAAVARVLHGELGEEVDSLFTDISRAYAHGYYGLLKEGLSLQGELFRFPLRGDGYPGELRGQGEQYSIRVINPYYAPLVAGKIWGLLEVCEDRDLELQDIVQGGGYMKLALVKS